MGDGCYCVIAPFLMECRVPFVISLRNIEGFLCTPCPHTTCGKSCSPVFVTLKVHDILTIPERQHHIFLSDNHEEDLVLSTHITFLLLLIVEYLHEECLLSIVQDETVLVEGVAVHDISCATTSILACIPHFNSVGR